MLRRRQHAGVVMARGIEFFPTRAALDQVRPYGDVLGKVTTAYGIFTTGRKLWMNQVEKAKSFKTIILPDPRSKSFKKYAESIDEYPQLQVTICKSNEKLVELYSIEVIWYPEMIHAAVVIGDPEKNSGWVHFELIMPHTKANMQPSITVYRNRHEETVADIWSAFNAIKGKSAPPDQEYIKQMLEGPQ